MSEIKTLDVEVSFPDVLEVDVDFGQTLTKIVAPEHYMGPFEFYPSDEDQIISVKDKTPVEDICVKGAEGILEITTNGTYSVIGKKSVTVDVEQIDALKFLQGTYYPLGYLRFPDGITVYDNLGCFANQTGLFGVDLNDVVTVKGGYNFKGCSNLKTAIAPNLQSADNGMFNGCIALYANECLNMAKTFPNLLSVSSNMFYLCNFSSLILSPSTTRLSSYCFDNCKKLEKIYYTSKIEQFGVSPFNACSACTDIYVPWSEGEVAGASWYPNRFNGTVHYNTVYDEEWNVISSE